jgi:DNA-binding GntR family transcriptional regulator
MKSTIPEKGVPLTRPPGNGNADRAEISLHGEILSRLRDHVVEGNIPDGARVPERQLCEMFGISRTPLREALKQLASEGLIELRLNRGAIVAPFRREELLELFEAVGGIERCAAELAATRMVARDVERLDALQQKIEWHHDRGELRDYFETNQQIHSTIVGFARNAVLKSTHDVLLPRAERARFFALSVQGRWDESVREHHDILTALRKKDGERAGRLLGHHVLRTGEIVAATLNGMNDAEKAKAPSKVKRKAEP